MIEPARMSTYPHHSTQVWSAGADYPVGAEEELAEELTTWARRYGVQALVKHEPGRIGMTTGGWTFPLSGPLPKMPPGTEPLWGHWLSGEPVGISHVRYGTLSMAGMCAKLRRGAEQLGWSGVIRIYGGDIYVCLDPTGQMTELEAHRKMVRALVGMPGRMQYPWRTWEAPGEVHAVVQGLDFSVPVERMRTTILNYYRGRAHTCRTELDGRTIRFSHEPLGYDEPDAQDAPTQEV